jgi:hypothetical protein
MKKCINPLKTQDTIAKSDIFQLFEKINAKLYQLNSSFLFMGIPDKAIDHCNSDIIIYYNIFCRPKPTEYLIFNNVLFI